MVGRIPKQPISKVLQTNVEDTKLVAGKLEMKKYPGKHHDVTNTPPDPQVAGKTKQIVDKNMLKWKF